jgi:hypothetical protein
MSAGNGAPGDAEFPGSREKFPANAKNTGIRPEMTAPNAAESATSRGKFPKPASREFFAALQGIESA